MSTMALALPVAGWVLTRLYMGLVRQFHHMMKILKSTLSCSKLCLAACSSASYTSSQSWELSIISSGVM